MNTPAGRRTGNHFEAKAICSAGGNDLLGEAEIRQLYTAGDAAHDFDHVLRVTEMGTRIAKAEGADVEVVRAAALLHDVPVEGSRRSAHHMAAAAFAAEYLQAAGMEAPRIDKVVHCIQAHRYRVRSIQPQTLEAKCLYDADKLDSIGAIGVGRAFAHTGNHACRLWSKPVAAAPPDHEKPTGPDYTPVHEYVYKLSHILPTLYTITARRIGAQRHEFMAGFYEQLDAEMTGRA